WLRAVVEAAPPGCEIGMEACGGAHHWARRLQALGFRVKLIAPQFVKPYVKSNKNDAHDAEAICEAMSRPSMRFVSVKSVEQQDIQAAHRVRAGLIEQRTAKANQIRGLVAEYRLAGLWADIRALADRLAELGVDIGAIALSDPNAVRLQRQHGVGPIIATALVAAVGDA